jgi:hypothetical protein
MTTFSQRIVFVFDIFSKSFERKPHPTTTTTKVNASHYYFISFARGRGWEGEKATRPLQSKPAPSKGKPIFFNMSVNDDAESKRRRRRLDDDAANFVYTGQENVPDGVIRVQVHPFFQQSRLISVELHNGIEVIEKDAFA